MESADQLAAMIGEIRERVRARHPDGAASGIPLPDLTPLLHARDAAEAKVASIGTVNPRLPGLFNNLIQSAKRAIARALDWHVRDQVEFNRGVMNCIQATLEALDDCKRSMAALGARIESLDSQFQGEFSEMKDIRRHWSVWREEWERKLAGTEIHFLRSVSDLQGSWQYRFNELDQKHADQMRALHADYLSALDRSGTEIQRRLWEDLARARAEYEKLIHSELRLLRQRVSRLGSEASGELRSGAPRPRVAGPNLDWMKFAERFRGTEDYVKRHASLYVERFAGCHDVLDLGCGRGELIEALTQAGISARGIDLSEECTAFCREKGLDAERADFFEFLPDLPDNSLGGMVCSQVVEHLSPEQLPELVQLMYRKLGPNGLAAIETPNPECLAIFARHFYLDPTHTRPVPYPLLDFYFEEAGFIAREVVRLEPAVESMPALKSLPEEFRRDFFGALDYALFARKP